MGRRAIIGALLLVGVGVVLGATVFRDDIAHATGLAQSVTVVNTAANPVPVQEQNVDREGNVKVTVAPGQNQLLLQEFLGVHGRAEIDVGSFEQIRIVAYGGSCGTHNGFGSVAVGVVQGGIDVLYRVIPINVIITPEGVFGANTETFDVPGQTLLVSNFDTDCVTNVIVYGRSD